MRIQPKLLVLPLVVVLGVGAMQAGAFAQFHLPVDQPFSLIEPDSDAFVIPNRYAPDELVRALLTADEVKLFAPYNFVVQEVEEDFEFITIGKVRLSKDKPIPFEAFVRQHFVITPPPAADKGLTRYDIWIYYRWMPAKYMKQMNDTFDDNLREHPKLMSSFIDELPREQLEFNYEKIAKTEELTLEERGIKLGIFTDPRTNFVRTERRNWARLANTYVGWRRTADIIRGSFYNIPQIVVLSGRLMGIAKLKKQGILVAIDYQMSNPWDPFAFIYNLMGEIENRLFETDKEQPLYHYDYYEPTRPIGP